MDAELDIIAERVLTSSSEGQEKPVRVIIGRPYMESDGAYFCPYRVVGSGPERNRRAGGVDAIQALQLALVKIGAELSASAAALKWNESASLGFPKTTHDPVIGGGEE